MNLIDYIDVALVVLMILLLALFTSHCEIESARKAKNFAVRRRAAKRVHVSDYDLTRRDW